MQVTEIQLSATPEPPLVDCHAHVFTGCMPVAPEAWHPPGDSAETAKFLQILDSQGVVLAVLAAASLFGDYNDYSLAATRENPRLRTTLILPPDTDPHRMREMADEGAVGIRLQLRARQTIPDLAGFEYRRFFRRVADLGWHVQLHDEGDRLAHLIPLVEKAGPRLVIDHFGRPVGGIESVGFRAVLAAVERGRTWVKLSAAFRQKPPGACEIARALLETAGPGRLLWGSDWPFVAHEKSVTYASALADYYALVPDPSFRREIDRTAIQFYFG